jgi:Zn-finger nucleic acid-binding protein
MNLPEYTIKLGWDDESAVWIATSGDIRGLILESGSLDALIERVRFAVPELLVLNGVEQEE